MHDDIQPGLTVFFLTTFIYLYFLKIDFFRTSHVVVSVDYTFRGSTSSDDFVDSYAERRAQYQIIKILIVNL